MPRVRFFGLSKVVVWHHFIYPNTAAVHARCPSLFYAAASCSGCQILQSLASNAGHNTDPIYIHEWIHRYWHSIWCFSPSLFLHHTRMNNWQGFDILFFIISVKNLFDAICNISGALRTSSHHIQVIICLGREKLNTLKIPSLIWAAKFLAQELSYWQSYRNRGYLTSFFL